jgi:hypothetical protein
MHQNRRHDADRAVGKHGRSGHIRRRRDLISRGGEPVAQGEQAPEDDECGMRRASSDFVSPEIKGEAALYGLRRDTEKRAQTRHSQMGRINDVDERHALSLPADGVAISRFLA